MVCNHCGAAYGPNDKFCKYCGAAIEHSKKKVVKEEEKEEWDGCENCRLCQDCEECEECEECECCEGCDECQECDECECCICDKGCEDCEFNQEDEEEDEEENIDYANVVPYKSKLTAILLAIFLGGYGAHMFYLEKFRQGMIRLLFCWTLIPAIVALIEALVYVFKKKENWIDMVGYLEVEKSESA